LIAQRLQEPIAFGDRYWLTELFAIGGMAEIYLARQNAMHGFEKEIVIKRLKPELAKDRAIVQMFLDEARIGAVLNHANIVHVYDVDEQDGVPYIAMEYIRGEELNQLCRRGLQLGQFLPLQHAVELLRQAAEGMGYFHARRDNEKRSLDIVHCDISPNNLLVTEDGFLKVIDFGIARAKTQRFRHDNAIPGKLSYMSPEQAQRSPVDWRSDIFSLGIVLYEITVGQRLFRGPSQEVVDRLISCDIKPPTFVRNNFPGALEAIVMRALEKHPDDRYQSAYDLADDLEMFLREAKLRSSPVRIARYLDELNVAAGGERRKELVSEAEIALAREDDDDLDFDRGTFDSYKETSGIAPAEVTAWDEYEESQGDVAAALGIDPSMLDPVTRTPIPHSQIAFEDHDTEDVSGAPRHDLADAADAADAADKSDESDDDEPPTGAFKKVAVDVEFTPEPAVLPKKPATAEKPAAGADVSKKPTVKPEAANKKSGDGAAKAKKPAAPVAKSSASTPEPSQPNWLFLGGGAAGLALTATVLYLLLS